MQVRNRGTIGGSVAHADPAADLPAVLLALGAQFVARDSDGARTIPADDFFVDLLTTALRPDELLVEVHIPVPGPRSGAAYRKFEEPASGYALVGVAAVVEQTEGKDTIARARVGLTGIGSKPYRAMAVEAALTNRAATPESLAAAAASATQGVEVAGDLHAAPDYRAHMATVFTRRSLESALQRA